MSQGDMAGMKMQPSSPPAATTSPAQGGMAGMPGMSAPAAPAQPAPAPSTATPPVQSPPPWSGDYAADRYFDPAAMAHARAMTREEMGGMAFSKVMLNLGEYQAGSGGGYRWDGEAWAGHDLDRFLVRSEGDGSTKQSLETAEAQALYSRAVGRYVDLQAGVRQDFAPRARTYLTLGARALAPYWFDLEGALFVSTQGQVLARAEGTYDLRLTQRLVLQPRAEFNFAASDDPRTRTGSGLSNAELGLRLRYEIRREFAPYVGVSWDRKVGRTASYFRAVGEAPAGAAFVVGLRGWF
ncbi:copper resistance protein B [Phenylobacterium montanum]|nr:copper resistance protein B [Caulobacter sp. S6]